MSHSTTGPPERPSANTDVAPRPIRLGIIHLIGWMASVGVALAILRITSGDSEHAPADRLSAQATQMFVGIAYGTALGGLALLLYRRVWHGATFPSQPGHWLFLLGTIGLLVDGAALLTARLAGNAFRAAGLGWHFPEYWFYQTLGWGVAVPIGAAALWFIARTQPLRWSLLAAAVWFAACANAVTHSLPLARELSGVTIPWLLGTWPYFCAPIVRLSTDSLCLAMLALAVTIEMRARIPRDWLHWSGVFAGALLPLVDGANRAWDLIRARW